MMHIRIKPSFTLKVKSSDAIVMLPKRIAYKPTSL